MEDVAEQLDTIEGKLDAVVERSIQIEQDVLWLKWRVRGVWGWGWRLCRRFPPA